MIYALGDLNVDMVWDFDAPPPTADDHAPSTGRCSIRIGGVAFNFHAMAREAGEQVRVVGQVGNDRAGTWIRSELTEGAGHLVAVHPSLPTCCLAIQQYADGQSLCRHWTMSEPNANQSVPEAAVAAAQRATRPGDILFTTGYGLFRPMGGSAVAGAIRGFAASGARVVFDVLPHRLQHMGTSASLRKRLAEVGTRFALAIGEYDTWRYLLAGSSPDAAPDSAQLEDLGRRAEECAEFVAIRYGFENCGREAVFHDG